MTNLSGTNLNNGAAVGPQGEGRDSPSTFPKYPDYKESGADWCGVVPAEWQVLKLKRVARLQSGEFITSEAIEEEAQYPVYGGNGLRGYTTAHTHEGEYALVGRQGALCGNINYACGKFWASEHAVVVYPERGAVTRWLGELLRSMNLGQYSVSAAQPGLSVERIADLFIPVPSPIEQTQIARFLDHETARIDALIEEQQRLIELLKEKRQAVISHAVTKGLDPMVPMKDSGVEWLGEVPAHWGVRKFYFGIKAIIDNRGRSPSYIDSGIPILEARQLSDEAMECSSDFSKYISEESHSEFVRDDVAPGDVLMVTVGTIGKVGVVGENPDYVILQNIVGFRCDYDIEPGFMGIYLKSGAAFMAMQATNKESILSSVKVSDFIQHKMPLPPLDEQKAIVRSVNASLSKYGVLQKEAELLCSTLHERRSALISAAVTGKIDVRGWQPPASAPSPELAQEAV
ncbi:restriction endonuclease subunit S [Ectopseudomonas oleovorans]|nr:restriction endonuclease subunit S [Pseudomonas oleovorans]PPV34048.1 restriction endonuclease subunit S [Pseudomonas oleovorans]